jgi:hypothetical protein
MNSNLKIRKPNSYPAIFASSEIRLGRITGLPFQKGTNSHALKKSRMLSPNGGHSNYSSPTFPWPLDTGNLIYRATSTATFSTATFVPYWGNSGYSRGESDVRVCSKEKSEYFFKVGYAGVACAPTAYSLPDFKICHLPNALGYDNALPEKHLGSYGCQIIFETWENSSRSENFNGWKAQSVFIRKQSKTSPKGSDTIRLNVDGTGIRGMLQMSISILAVENCLGWQKGGGDRRVSVGTKTHTWSTRSLLLGFLNNP